MKYATGAQGCETPAAVPAPAPGFKAAPPVLALGGEMKAAVCLTKGDEAPLSRHLGELGNPLAREAWQIARRDYAALFDHCPTRLAVGLHPGCRATLAGEALAAETGLPLFRIQHHHVHLASCCSPPRPGR